MMYDLRPDVEPSRILDLELSELESLRDKVFSRILSYISKNPKDDLLVDTHATFRKGLEGLFAGFTPQEVVDFRPDMCVNLMADVDEVKARLVDSDFPLKDMTLRDIMVWREEELLGSELMADLVKNCKYYAVPRYFDAESLEKLIFNREAPKCYLSFPITGELSPEVKKQIADFRNAFRALGNLVTFDPLSGTAEPVLVSKMHKAKVENPDARTISVSPLGKTIELNIEELEAIEPYVDGQIKSFDLRMVAQSDATIAFFPEIGGKSYAAPGVVIELAYARHKVRDRFLIWTGNDPVTAMLKPFTKKFDSLHEAVDFFKSGRYRRR